MDSAKLIKKLLVDKDLNTVDLANKLGCGTANLYNKYKRNNFSVNELEQIAEALDCNLSIQFVDRDSGKAF